MSGFRNVSEIVAAIDAGQYHITTWRKSVGVAVGGGLFYDMSMAAGNPSPNYYASNPAVAAALARSTHGGIHHGSVPPDGMKKYLLRSMLIQVSTLNAILGTAILCDYLLYYPFVDSSDGSDQPMDNTVALPRYSTGEGVQIIPIVVAPFSGIPQFYCTYTNQDGVAGRVTQTTNGRNGLTYTGALLNTTPSSNIGMQGPFMALQAGDTGVRRIESVTFTATDVGLVCFALVKPLVNAAQNVSIDAPVEKAHPVDSPTLVEIQNDAYLNLLVGIGGSNGAAVFNGVMEFIWN